MLIPGYEIERLIAEGGTSSVYLAVQKSLGRRVAIKVLRKFDSTQQAERFLHEARIIASLEHRNVITIYDVSSVGECYYIAMEYLEGGSLTDRIERGIKPELALDLLESVASCLDFVHRRDIVHRDIKPGNILFHADGTPKLTDFGIAKQLDGDQEMTLEGSAFGSPYYLSPEQAEGRTLDGRSDIYGLGIVFYQMLTGRRPYAESSHIETIVAHLSNPIPVLPEELSQYQNLLEQMIAKRPENRVASAHDLTVLIGKVRAKRPKWRLGFAPSERVDDMDRSGAAQNSATMGRPLSTRLSIRVSAVALLVLVAVSSLIWWLGDGGREQVAAPLAKRAPVVALRYDVGGGRVEQRFASVGPVEKEAFLVPESEPTPAIEPDEQRSDTTVPAVETVEVSSPELARNGLTAGSDGETDRRPKDQMAPELVASDQPDEGPEAVSLEAERGEIDNLMMAGNRALEANRLTRPAGDNAYESYLKVVEFEPGNSGAEAGIDQIADRYAALAGGAFSKKDYRLARVYVERGLRVRSRHAGLLAIRDRVNETERVAANAPVSEDPVAAASPPHSARMVSREFEGTSITSRGPEGTGNIVKDFKNVWRSVFD